MRKAAEEHTFAKGTRSARMGQVAEIEAPRERASSDATASWPAGMAQHASAAGLGTAACDGELFLLRVFAGVQLMHRTCKGEPHSSKSEQRAHTRTASHKAVQ